MRRLSTTASRRLLLAGLSAVLLSACAATPPRADPESRVAAYFDPPQRYPGPTWTRDGRDVDSEELNSIAGPEHCGWDSVVMMHLGWPLGTVSRTSAEIRQYIRDPNQVIRYGVPGKVEIGVDLPPDARDTGYRNGALELWLAASDPHAAFLRAADEVERWPRADPVVACD